MSRLGGTEQRLLHGCVVAEFDDSASVDEPPVANQMCRGL